MCSCSTAGQASSAVEKQRERQRRWQEVAGTEAEEVAGTEAINDY